MMSTAESITSSDSYACAKNFSFLFHPLVMISS